MTIHVALKTLRMIDAMIKEDQGARFRGWLQKVIPHIGDAYRTENEGHRSHMGASLLGGECARAIWYNFRWATKGDHEGRILRLFNRGHLEEARFIALLLMVGTQVFQQDAQGKQYRISFADGHAGGSGDGVGIGIPDLPVDTAGLCEFKTHGDKSFIELAGPLKEWRAYVAGEGPFLGKGLRDAKFEHYVQMQLYMRKMGLAAGLYMAVNKNTDDLYAEIVVLNSELADQFIARGDLLVWMDQPPEKLNPSPGFFKCRFCDHRPVCHQKAAPDKNCRTCIYSEPTSKGEWLCRFHDRIIDKPTQYVGCNAYEVSKVYGK